MYILIIPSRRRLCKQKAGNSALQIAVHKEAEYSGWEGFIPRLGFSLDNAGMVAVTGYYKFLAGQFVGLDAIPFARTTLE